MDNHNTILRALALVLPLAAAAPQAVLAQSSKPATAATQTARTPVVPADFPADAAQHIQQLNADTSTPDLRQGARGPAVIRAQVMLDRAWFSVGEIDGLYGSNMTRIVKAFQTSRGLPVTGNLDAATWQALGTQQPPAFATYVLTDQDINGPYTKTPEDPKEQSQMPTLGYQDAAEALGERFHMSPKLLAALNKGRNLQAGQSIVVTDVGRAQPPAARVTLLRLDKSDRILYVIGESDKLVGAFPVSLGRPELPEGQLQIVTEVKNPDFSYDPALLRDAKSDEKLKLPPGANNPVGVVWLGLSKEHAGIHGTAEPSQMARVETNGCVRLTNWDVVRLSTVVDKGATVEVQA